MKMNTRKAFTMIEMVIVMVIVLMIGGCVGGIVLVGCGVKKGAEYVDDNGGMSAVGDRIMHGNTNDSSTNAGTTGTEVQ